jgi:hypothetical protein
LGSTSLGHYQLVWIREGHQITPSRHATTHKQVRQRLVGTGKQRRTINKLDFILCPRCHLCRETTEHVLYCSQLSPITQAHRATLKSTINSVTPDTITNILLSVLRQLSVSPDNRPKLDVAETLPVEVQQAIKRAIRQQYQIGWALLLRGYLSKE